MLYCIKLCIHQAQGLLQVVVLDQASISLFQIIKLSLSKCLQRQRVHVHVPYFSNLNFSLKGFMLLVMKQRLKPFFVVYGKIKNKKVLFILHRLQQTDQNLPFFSIPIQKVFVLQHNFVCSAFTEQGVVLISLILQMVNIMEYCQVNFVQELLALSSYLCVIMGLHVLCAMLLH